MELGESNNNNNNKQTMGRQKIEMKRIRKKEGRVTTFFKRRCGIYKKAAEISALCGAEVGFGTFSPAGNAFAFATSSMDSIADRFLNNDHQGSAASAARLEGLTETYNELERRLAAEREAAKAAAAAEEEEIVGWWEAPVERLGLEELRKMGESVRKLHRKLWDHINGDGQKSGNSNASSSLTPVAGRGDGRSGEKPN